jgi:hypothetical protein
MEEKVRKLAERSSRATKEIATLIAEVQQGTEDAVKAMQQGAMEVGAGAKLADEAGASLDASGHSVRCWFSLPGADAVASSGRREVLPAPLVHR